MTSFFLSNWISCWKTNKCHTWGLSNIPSFVCWSCTTLYFTGCSFVACTLTLLRCEMEETKLQCKLQLGLALVSRLIKVHGATGWGCPCGENCWLKLELLAKVADFEAGPETTMQCGQDERSGSKARWSNQAGSGPHERKNNHELSDCYYMYWVWGLWGNGAEKMW